MPTPALLARSVQVEVFVDVFQDWHSRHARVEHSRQPLSTAAVDQLRLLTWGGSIVCALLLQPYLQYVTALVGINSLLISILLPLLFYVQVRVHGTLEHAWHARA